jgi:TorA maturation chaperone TorD
MRREYQRLFEFPSAKVQPYEYAYRGASTTPGQTAERLRMSYREAGLEISSHFKDLPDHVCLELELLARLMEKEAAGRSREARRRRDFEESLRSWFPRFLAAIRDEARDPYYLELALLSESIFRQERGVVS